MSPNHNNKIQYNWQLARASCFGAMTLLAKNFYFVYSLCNLLLAAAALDSYVNKGLDHDERCGCPPDAAMTTQYDTKVFVFAGFYFWFFDPFENAESMKLTTKRIDEELEGLSGNIDAAFNAFDKYYIIKGRNLWMYDQNLELLNISSTQKWENFPRSPDAIQVSNRTSDISTLEVVVDDLVIFCYMDKNDTVSCPLNQTRNLDDDEKSVGLPIKAIATTSSGLQLIFGKDLYCTKLPSKQECMNLCHPIIFTCKQTNTDIVILVGIILAMTVSVILVAVFFWENTISASGGQVHARRGM